MRRFGLAVAVIATAGSLLAAGCSSSGTSVLAPAGAAPNGTTSPESVVVSGSQSSRSINNGQEPSTMKPGKQFTVVPDFTNFQGCGEPCWLPLYVQPRETPPAVTNGWPCEFYDSSSTAGGSYCLHAPANRPATQMGDGSDPNSGDRVLVLCQTTRLSDGQPAQTIRNEAGQESNVWDRVAVPSRYVKAAMLSALKLVTGMPGFYAAYAPDIWLLNTSWNVKTNQASLKVHDIPCK
jgi:hypothetical protein